MSRDACDDLDTHPAASFYEALAPAEAKRLADRVEVVCTLVQGSWERGGDRLNVVEVEFSVLARRCLRRSIGTLSEMAAEVLAWVGLRDAEGRHAEGSTVEWQVTTDGARVKPSRLYPTA